MSTPGKPDLDQLIAALLADASPGELHGRDEAAAAFRTAGRPAADRQPGRGGRPWLPAAGLPRRLALAGLVLAVVIAGITAAAYASALPGPAQHLAHSAFAPLGVPDLQGDQLSADTSATPGTGGAATTSAGTGRSGYRVIVIASRGRVLTGARVTFTGRVTEHGHGAALVQVRLYERYAKSGTFTLVATGRTGPFGGFRLESGPLPRSAVFRVLGPDSVHSAAVRVVVTGPRASGTGSTTGTSAAAT